MIADGFSRADKLQLFRDQFLGKTKAGRSCTILNEADISFSYDSKTYKLSAFSAVPIRIQNNYLGYEITFSLVEFDVRFYKRSIKSADVISSYFAGTTFYKDNSNGQKSYVDKRKKNYLGSEMQFFRNLTQNLWNKKNFLLFDGSYMTNPNDHFKVRKESGTYTVTINNSGENKTLSIHSAKKFSKSFNLLYDNSKQSNVMFNSEVIKIDEFGNNENFNVVLFGGELGKRRAGDMLPMDFVL